MNEDMDRQGGDGLTDDIGSLGRTADDVRRIAKRGSDAAQRSAPSTPPPNVATPAASAGGTAAGGGSGAAGTPAAAGASAGSTPTAAGTSAAAAGGAEAGGAAAAGGAEAGGATAAGGAAGGVAVGTVLLIALAVILVLLMLIGLFVLIPSAISNGLLHQNDPAALSGEIEIFDFGDYDTNKALIQEQKDLFEDTIQSVLDQAERSTEASISSYADSMGWTIDYGAYQRPSDSDIREVAVFLLSAYSASIQNGIGEDQWNAFMNKDMLDDMRQLMVDYRNSSSPREGFLGNGYYGGDFLRDEDGNISIRKVAHSYVDSETGETYIYYTYHVTPVIYDVDIPAVAEGAFLSGGRIDEPYDKADNSPHPATYWDVTLDMARALGEFLYGTDFWEGSQSFWGGVMNVVGVGSSDIVKVATSQIGNKGHTYQRWYGVNSSTPWCAIFASWCADQCGYIDAGICPKSASTGMYRGSFAEFYQSKGRWMPRSSGYQPQPGDFILFLWDKDRAKGKHYSHIGIVTCCDGEKVYTVEGNSGRTPGGIVGSYSYKLTDHRIVGYGVPDYPVRTPEAVEPTSSPEAAMLAKAS